MSDLKINLIRLGLILIVSHIEIENEAASSSLIAIGPSFYAISKTAKKYKVVHEAVENVRTRPEAPFLVKLRKHNRTTPVLDGILQIKDLKVNTWQTWIEGYERLGLEHVYTKSAVSLSCTFCEFLTGKFLFNMGLRDYGNFPSRCPLKLGNYTIKDYVIEDKYLPPVVPGHFWKLDFISGPLGSKSTNQSMLLSYYCKVVYI